MTLHINGEQRDFPDGLTVAALVAQLGMKPDRVAVELNLEIVPRTQWDATMLKNGDKLEVVHFVGGGSTSLAGKETSVLSRGEDWGCPTCGRMAASEFCPDCGEKEFSPADLSVRHFFSHALGEFFHFDSKIGRSFRLLFTKPGFLTSEYLRGCRRPYLHPFQLLFCRQPDLFFPPALPRVARTAHHAGHPVTHDVLQPFGIQAGCGQDRSEGPHSRPVRSSL
jgi:sulfur carrier protein